MVFPSATPSEREAMANKQHSRNHPPVVLVTGSSSGIGQATCLNLLQNGFHVLGSMRRGEERGGLLIEKAGEHSSHLEILSLDVTNPKDIHNTRQFIEKSYGHLDALVNNAGFGLFGALEDLSEEQIREQMEVNFFGAVALTKQLLPLLRESRGRIINISSLLGYSGMPLTSLYCASKWALEGLSESLYYELAPLGVQVALVEPGGHRTNFSKNIVWGSSSADSPYEGSLRRYQKLSSDLASGKGVSPDTVADTIVRLLKKKRMPLRVRCGIDARGMSLLNTFVPEAPRTFALRKVFEKVLLRERP